MSCGHSALASFTKDELFTLQRVVRAQLHRTKELQLFDAAVVQHHSEAAADDADDKDLTVKSLHQATCTTELPSSLCTAVGLRSAYEDAINALGLEHVTVKLSAPAICSALKSILPKDAIQLFRRFSALVPGQQHQQDRKSNKDKIGGGSSNADPYKKQPLYRSLNIARGATKFGIKPPPTSLEANIQGQLTYTKFLADGVKKGGIPSRVCLICGSTKCRGGNGKPSDCQNRRGKKIKKYLKFSDQGKFQGPSKAGVYALTSKGFIHEIMKARAQEDAAAATSRTTTASPSGSTETSTPPPPPPPYTAGNAGLFAASPGTTYAAATTTTATTPMPLPAPPPAAPTASTSVDWSSGASYFHLSASPSQAHLVHTALSTGGFPASTSVASTTVRGALFARAQDLGLPLASRTSSRTGLAQRRS